MLFDVSNECGSFSVSIVYGYSTFQETLKYCKRSMARNVCQKYHIFA